MSWTNNRSVFERRLEFVKLLVDGRFRMTELCEMFGVARSNAYKWRDRYLAEGVEGLRDRSRGPKRYPHKTSDAVVQLLLDEKDKHPSWGPRKLMVVLARDYPDLRLPAPSTGYELLKKHGRVQSRRRRKKHEHSGKPFVVIDLPSSTWAADFKGEFRLGNGRNCSPLTITDGYSRFLVMCRALSSTKTEPARAAFRTAFREPGMPEAILTDNGSPFASTGLSGLTRLSVWLMRLGVRCLRTQPGCPQQNGQHERMHRTMKAEATRPPKQTMVRQQKEFNRFQEEYNYERPQQALGMDPPVKHYEISPRRFPERLPKVVYPAHFTVRRVSKCGTIRWHSHQVYMSKALQAQFVGLEEVGHGLWDVYFATTMVGRFNERTMSTKGPVRRNT
jgi:transposase InsO family protein